MIVQGNNLLGAVPGPESVVGLSELLYDMRSDGSEKLTLNWWFTFCSAITFVIPNILGNSYLSYSLQCIC